MGYLVQNRSGREISLPTVGQQRTVQPGGRAILTEDEFSKIPSNQRGPHGLYVLNFDSGREERARKGESYFAGTGRITAPPEGINMRTVLRNPADSVRTAYLYSLVMFTTAGPTFHTLIDNPDAGIPTNQIRPVNNVIVGSTNGAELELLSDTHVSEQLSGGVDTGIVLGMISGRTEFSGFEAILNPGSSIGIDSVLPGSMDIYINFYWYEEHIYAGS